METIKSVIPQKDVLTIETRAQYECEMCCKRFIKFRYYNNHLVISHKLPPKHKCPQCDLSFPSVTSLEHHHMTQCHTLDDDDHDTSDSPPICRICQKSFHSKSALKIHMRFHSGNLPYECSSCGKRFSDNGHLRQHTRVKHEQFRFKCTHEHCTKSFETDRALRHHNYEHEQRWPFVCSLCGKGIGTKYNCRMHVARRHKINVTDEALTAMQQFKRQKSSQSHCLLMMPDAKSKFGEDKKKKENCKEDIRNKCEQ